MKARGTMDGAGKKLVAHMVPWYLPYTANWIHTMIRHTRDYGSLILTSKLIDPESYPADRVYCSRLSGRFLFADRVFRRLGWLPLPERISFSTALRRHRPLLIHAHFGWDGYFALGLRKRFRLPLITRFYGYDVGQLPQIPLWRRRYARLFAEGDLFIAEGQNMRRLLVELGCPPDRIEVHHLGVELDRIEPREPGPPGGPLRVLMCGFMKEKKGFEYALRALHRARQTLGPDALSVRFMGTGPLETPLRRLCSDLDLEGTVEWLGFRPPSEFLRELRDADVFLAPSVTAADGDTEGGAPVAIIEAGAAGVPAISTTHADIPDVVIDGRTGLLAPERDFAALADALVELARSEERRRELGEEAQKHVRAQYDAVAQGELLGQIYARFDPDRGGSRPSAGPGS